MCAGNGKTRRILRAPLTDAALNVASVSVGSLREGLRNARLAAHGSTAYIHNRAAQRQESAGGNLRCLRDAHSLNVEHIGCAGVSIDTVGLFNKQIKVNAVAIRVRDSAIGHRPVNNEAVRLPGEIGLATAKLKRRSRVHAQGAEYAANLIAHRINTIQLIIAIIPSARPTHILAESHIKVGLSAGARGGDLGGGCANGEGIIRPGIHGREEQPGGTCQL